ncbi:hypothetical protein [Spirillospora sp. NPDC048819]|uniref:hypothetical protein n=1 Tax=Spirillospora sp. NPDC048819 TaxID=3155268 RepID=UPI0033C8D6AD
MAIKGQITRNWMVPQPLGAGLAGKNYRRCRWHHHQLEDVAERDVPVHPACPAVGARWLSLPLGVAFR